MPSGKIKIILFPLKISTSLADDGTVIEWPIMSVIRPSDEQEEGINPVMTACKGEMKAFQYPH